MHKKSQGALEFLTTYVWAFLVIAITLGALYYFGVFNFSKYLPQKCTFPSQFKCLDFSLASNPTNNVRIKLVNNIGEDVCIKSATVTNDVNPPISCGTFIAGIQGRCSASEFEWDSETTNEITFQSCSGGGYVPNERIELKISVIYYAIDTPSKPNHVINGKINGKVTS